MAAPTLVTSGTISYVVRSTAASTASLSVQAGDLLVFCVAGQDVFTNLSVSGGGLTWTQQANPGGSFGDTQTRIFTAVASTSTSFACTLTPGGNTCCGGFVTVWRNHGGVGSVASTSSSGSQPSLSITTTKANSALVVVMDDFNGTATGGETYRTVNVSFTQLIAQKTNGTLRGGYYSDAGAAGSKATGATAPTGQDCSHSVLEVLPQSTTSIAVGQVIESDIAQPVTRVKRKSLGLVVEVDTTFSITRGTPSLRQVVEVDQAQPLSRVKRKTLGQAVELESTQSVAKRKLRSTSIVTESDTTQPLAKRKLKSLNQVIESDNALAVTRSSNKFVVIGQATEVDTPQSLRSVKRKTLGLVTEVDIPSSVTRKSIRAVNQVVEVDTAQAIGSFSPIRRRFLGIAAEAEEVFTIDPVKAPYYPDISTRPRYHVVSNGYRVLRRVK